MSSKRKRKCARSAAAPAFYSASQLLTLPQWARLNSIGLTSARRLIKAGLGPRVIKISPRRLGIRMADNDEWQAARVRDAR